MVGGWVDGWMVGGCCWVGWMDGWLGGLDCSC